nr:retrovirus-related Pol polyprotein from transposon TNT 1-94 [Tanacetum cinerariifolium]
MAMSSAEAKYVATVGCCASILWMKSQLSDYDIHYKMFWSTAVAFDPFPSTDEPEKCPLMEFLIKFSVLNGQRPLTLDFKTCCSSTGLDYNNGKYVEHPTPEVLDRNYSSTEKVNSIQQLLAYSLITETKVDIDLKRDIQLASTGLPSTLDEGTRKSKPLPEGTMTHPKDSGGNVQPFDRDLTFTTFDEGMAKTTPRPEGSLGDKDLKGNIPPIDMELIHTTVVDPSWTVAKYQVDQTQSTRLRQRSLTKNKVNTSFEVESDTEPLKLQIFADIQAFLLFEDELDKESDEEEVLAAGDDMDEDIQAAKEVKTPSPKKMSRVLFSRITNKQWEQFAEATTNKLVEAFTSSLKISDNTISDLYKGLNVITELLKNINTDVKDDPAANQKILKATETFAKISSIITGVLSLVKGFDFFALLVTRVELSQKAFKRKVSSLRQDTSKIESMMTKMYTAFKAMVPGFAREGDGENVGVVGYGGVGQKSREMELQVVAGKGDEQYPLNRRGKTRVCI